MLQTSSTKGIFMNTLNEHEMNEHQINELQPKTTNAHYITTHSHKYILEPQVTAITEATNIESETMARSNITWLNAGFQYDTTTDYASNYLVTIGRMTDVCPHCNAQKWKKEPPTPCCSNGKVRLQLIKEPPLILNRLLEENTAIQKHFRSIINKYNSAFQMTSFGTEHNLGNHGFFTTFKIKGQYYHKIGGLLKISEKKQSSFKCISWEIHKKRPSNEEDMLVEALI